MNALEGLFLLWSRGTQGRTQAAWAAFTHGIESMTIAQVQQHLATDGIEITLDAAAELQIECRNQGPRGVLAVFEPQQEHAITALDVCDCASEHGVIVTQGGAA